MNLSTLLPFFHRPVVSGPSDVALSAVTDDSRQVKPGMIFAALKGEKIDGNQYVEKPSPLVHRSSFPIKRRPRNYQIKSLGFTPQTHAKHSLIAP